MTLTIDLTPAEEARLNAVADREDLNLLEAARQVLMNGLAPEPEEVLVAFEGHIECVTGGVATLRLVDPHGQRSVATYAVADLTRDNIPAEAGTAFQCRITRHSHGIQISFQPAQRRVVSKVERRRLENKAIDAYAALQNDY